MPAVIAGAAESPYTRHPDPATTTTESLLADAFLRALESAGIDRAAVDGLGVTSFTLAPDHAIDLAWRLGVRVRWLMDDPNGGAAGINMLQHAVRAIEAGDAETIVLLAGDRLLREEFSALVDGYNRATQAYLAPLPIDGPNTHFALLTQRHMAATGLSRAKCCDRRRKRSRERRSAMPPSMPRCAPMPSVCKSRLARCFSLFA
jgi:acetyl-CoA acetyltransferase